MDATRTLRKLLLLVLTTVLVFTVSVGQAKPPPETVNGDGPATAAPRGKANPQAVDQTPQGPNVDGFAEAYERANDPPMLILVGRDTRTFELPGQAATGVRSDVAPQVIGGTLNLIDVEGNAMKLHGDIEQIFLEIDDVEVDLISLDGLAEADRREVNLLQQQDEQKAVDLLATKLNAEVVLLVKLLETNAVAAKGARYRVIVEAIDVPRGRKIGGFTFDWMEGTDSRTIKRYAQEITRKFMEQFIRAKSRGGNAGQAERKYTVRFIGLEQAAQLKAARDAFQDVDGVSKVRTRGMSKAQGTSIATLEVTYAGDPLDLVFDSQDAMSTSLGMKADASDIQAGTITFKAGALEPELNFNFVLFVTGIKNADEAVAIRKKFVELNGVKGIEDRELKIDSTGFESNASWIAAYEGQTLDLAQQAAAAVSDVTGSEVRSDLDRIGGYNRIQIDVIGPTPRWQILVSEDHPQHKTMRTSFLTEYRGEGSPKIGIMVNRALSEPAEQAAAPGLEDEVVRLSREDPDNPNLPALIAALAQSKGEAAATPNANNGNGGGGISQAGQSSDGGVVVSITTVTGDLNQGADQAAPVTPKPGDKKEEQDARDETEPFDLQLNNMRVENAIYKKFIQMGLTMVDPNSVRDRIAAKAEKAKRVYNEEELVWLLGREAGLDIVILGHGRLIETKADPKAKDNDGKSIKQSIVYTFRAVRVNDGVTLAADTTADELGAGEDEANRFIQYAAHYFAGNLADQLWTQWEPPRMVTVTLHNAKTQKDVITVMNSIRDNVKSVDEAVFLKHEAGAAGGFGEFTIRYKDTYENLIESIAKQEQALPFDLDASGTDRDTLTIRLRD